MSNPHLVVIPILLVLGCAGAWYWIRRPLGQEPPRGDSVLELWEAMERDERTLGRRFTQVAVALMVLAAIGGALAGILRQVGL